MPQTGCLDATEWGAQVTDVVGVQPDHAGFNLLREVVGALQIRSPDVGSQAVLGVVGQLEGFFIGVEWRDCNDWTEDFFLEASCRWIHVDKHGWLHEVALWEFCGALTTGVQLRFLLADLDVRGDLLVVLWVDQCTDFGGWVRRQANLDALSLGCIALDEFVVDAAL